MILGMSFDAPEENAAFAEKFGFPFPLLTDADRSIAIAYGAADDASAAFPQRAGVIVGPDGRIVAYHSQVEPAAFPRQALDALPG